MGTHPPAPRIAHERPTEAMVAAALIEYERGGDDRPEDIVEAMLRAALEARSD